MTPSFTHYELFLPKPDFDSALTTLIIELDHLRRVRLYGTTSPVVFFQLKKSFHMLESIGSARIEGNNTTILEYFETKEKVEEEEQESYDEIQNIEKCLEYIEEVIKESKVNRSLISDLHKKVVEGLNPKNEGDSTPGQYRKQNLQINKSEHLPPDWTQIDEYMEELFTFINETHDSKYDLLKVAIAHHRFVWIHPFKNGNGRVVRLLTYAMLMKQGFKVDVGSRIVNPTAIFCIDRDKYYEMLGQADKGTESGIITWCEYVLKGLKEEIEKIDKLLDYNFLKREVLLPAVKDSLDRREITLLESTIVKRAIEHVDQFIQAADIKDLFTKKDGAVISRYIKKMIQKELISPIEEGSRKYTVRFHNGPLMKGFVKALGHKGFLSPDYKKI